MLAWCVLSTLIIILLTIRRWLLRKLGKDSRCDLCIPATHEDTQDTFDVPQTSATPQPTPQDTEDNPVVPQTSATPQPTLTPQPADVVVQLHSPPSLYTTPSSSTATPPHPVLIVLLSHWLPLKGLLLSVPDCKWPRNLLCKLTIIGVILCQVIFFLRDATAFDFFFYANDALIDAKYIF